MGKILLDFVFPITTVTPTPAASTAFLKQACVVAKPKSGQEGNVGNLYLCTNMSQVSDRTDNENAEQLFDAGMNRVYVLLANDLDLTSFINENLGIFFTLLISDDFVDADFTQVIDTPAVKASKVIGDLTFTADHAGVAGNSITVELVDSRDDGGAYAHAVGNVITIQIEAGVTLAGAISDACDESVSTSNLVDVTVQDNVAQGASGPTNLEDGAAAVTEEGTGLQVGNFDGVTGISTQDGDVAIDQAAIERRCAFFTNSTNKAKNLFYAFGKLLSNQLDWLNQQYITMPFNDDVDELGEAEELFDSKVSFVINDDEFDNRLALFACGAKAIVAPYILKNLKIDLASRALQWISGNEPQYTKKEAALLETRLQEDVINLYINSHHWIAAGVVEIKLEQDNFVASGLINVAEPKALWRVFGELRQTL